MEFRPLGETGLSLYAYGFGCAALGNVFSSISDAECWGLLETAWDRGIRYFDVAPLYGNGLAERRVGAFLRTKPRDEFVLSTKAGRLLKKQGAAESVVFDYSRDGVVRSLEASLTRLGLDHADILLMHDLGSVTHGEMHVHHFKEAMAGGYEALSELRETGTVKAIGLGVNEWEVCDAALDHRSFDCFLLAGRYTLLEQNALKAFLPRCAGAGVSIIIGGPFNSGILAKGAVEGVWYNYEPAPISILERVRQIEKTCERHGIPLAAAALQFPLTHPIVVSVVAGMASKAEVSINHALAEMDLPLELWADLKAAGLVDADAPAPK